MLRRPGEYYTVQIHRRLPKLWLRNFMRGGLCSKSNKKVIERPPRSNLLPILLPCALRKNCLKCCQRRLDQSSINSPNPSEFEEIKDVLRTQIPQHVKVISIHMQWRLRTDVGTSAALWLPSVLWNRFLRKRETSPQTIPVSRPTGTFQVPLLIYRQHDLVIYVARDCCNELQLQTVKLTLFPRW